MQRVGSRCQVMHGNAKMTGGGLKKKDLKYNKQGKIVSKKMSTLAKKKLQKAGYTTKKGQIGSVRSMRGGGNITVTIQPYEKAGNLFQGFELKVNHTITINELKTQIIKQINETLSETAEKLGIVKKTLSEEPTTLSLSFYNKRRVEIYLDNPTLNSTLADYGVKNENIITVKFMCLDWASEGECVSNPEYMEQSCKAECQCLDWASEGECVTNPRYMNHHCKDACDLVKKIKKKWELKKKRGQLIYDTRLNNLLSSRKNKNNGTNNSNSLNNKSNKAYKKNLEKIKEYYKNSNKNEKYSGVFKLYENTAYKRSIPLFELSPLNKKNSDYLKSITVNHMTEIEEMKKVIKKHKIPVNLEKKLKEMEMDEKNYPNNIFVYLYSINGYMFFYLNEAILQDALDDQKNKHFKYYAISINRYIYDNSFGKNRYNFDTLEKEMGYNVVWRGTQLSGINSDIFDSFKTFRLPRYVSTSSEYTVAEYFYKLNSNISNRFPIMLKILFRDDCEYIAPVSSVSSYEEENEYLIKPYTLFYIVGEMKIIDGRITYTLLISNNKSQKEFIDSIVLDPSLPINVRGLLEDTEYTLYSEGTFKNACEDIVKTNKPVNIRLNSVVTEKLLQDKLDELFGFAYVLDVDSSNTIATIKSVYDDTDFKILTTHAKKLTDIMGDREFTYNLIELINIHYGKPYAQSPNNKKSNNGITVYRPNHPLDHGIRQGKIAVDIINLIEKNESTFNQELYNFVKSKKKDYLFKRKVQFVSSFQRTGRRNENPRGTTVSSVAFYKKCGRTDIEFFKQAAIKSGFFTGQDEIDEYADGIEDSALNRGYRTRLGSILYVAHTIDLLRMRMNIASNHNVNNIGADTFGPIEHIKTELKIAELKFTNDNEMIKLLINRGREYMIANGIKGYLSFNKKWYTQNDNHMLMAVAVTNVPIFPKFPTLEEVTKYIAANPSPAEDEKLGGFNGARKIEIDGNPYVYKPKVDGSPGGSSHIKSEDITNSVLRSIGVPVPLTKYYDGGSPAFLLSEFKNLKKIEESNYDDAAKHYVAHTLLANHDVIGSDDKDGTIDNTQVIVESNHILFIDNGGALKYTGTGAKKNERWFGNDVRLEMDRMRGIIRPELEDPEIILPELINAELIFGRLTNKQIKDQITRIKRQKNFILEYFQSNLPDLHNKMSNRIDSLNKYENSYL